MIGQETVGLKDDFECYLSKLIDNEFLTIINIFFMAVSLVLGLIDTRHFDKQYCDEKIFFIQYFFSCVN